jgi:hypothetical protein
MSADILGFEIPVMLCDVNAGILLYLIWSWIPFVMSVTHKNLLQNFYANYAFLNVFQNIDL